LFPVFGRARENALRSSCQSNLNQIGLSVAKYLQLYDETYPLYQAGGASRGWAGTPVTSGLSPTRGIIYPYLKSDQILQCPSEPTAQSWSLEWTDYFYNGVVGFNTSTNGPGARHMSALEAPAVTILLGESISSDSNASSWGGAATNSGGVWSSGGTGVAVASSSWSPATSGMRHLEGANYAFADGHVKFLRPGAVTKDGTGAGNPTFRIQNDTTLPY
jgi:prepilin-type processing-associated H-X9-DG protein